MTTLTLTVLGDEQAADTDVRQLREELRHLKLDSIDLAPGPVDPPAGSKGVDQGAVTTLVLVVSGSPVLTQLAGVLRDWVNRGQGRRIVVRDGARSLELDGTNDEDNGQAIAAFFAEPS
jgi:hypothetical protein